MLGINISRQLCVCACCLISNSVAKISFCVRLDKARLVSLNDDAEDLSPLRGWRLRIFIGATRIASMTSPVFFWNHGELLRVLSPRIMAANPGMSAIPVMHLIHTRQRRRFHESHRELYNYLLLRFHCKKHFEQYLNVRA